MKERPILFKGEMIRAILEGRKTQARRVCGIQFHRSEYEPDDIGWQEFDKAGNLLRFCDGFLKRYIEKKSPYGQPGDHLWVRETWAKRYVDADEHPEDGVMYRADGRFVSAPKWTPSTHMPRWASRITLEITAVRVERLQDITEYDIHCKGIIGSPQKGMFAEEQYLEKLTEEFIDFWDSIAKPGEQWENNPWVWVYEFRHLKPRSNQC